jgi:hypothetical protein
MPFWISIALLSLAQGGLVALPRRAPQGWLVGLESRWWAVVPPASIAVVIGVIAAWANSANALAYLALVAVPILAALALAQAVRGAQARFAIAVPVVFATAWALQGEVIGQLAALMLSALACVALGSLLASQVPGRWLGIGVYSMAILDAFLVGADLLQGPNGRLTAASPAADLPQLQVVHLGSAVMGFGDFFIAATVGALLASRLGVQLKAALLAVLICLAFDLFFLVANELPTTVPVALVLATVELRDRRAKRGGNAAGRRRDISARFVPRSLQARPTSSGGRAREASRHVLRRRSRFGA